MADTMRRRASVLTALVLSLVVLSTAAAAGTFTVTLTNGTSFETRYRPVEAEWDDGVVLIHTDRGNPIALFKDDIADVTSSVEESGFGYQVDTTTVFVGWKPADEMEEGEDGEGAQSAADRAAAFEPEPLNFNIQQFVNPGETGGVDLPIYTGYGPQPPPSQ